MKSSHRSENLIIVPILTVTASIGIVLQESVRYDTLSRELAGAQGEYSALQKRASKLRKAAGIPAPSESSPGKVAATHHHDGDGD